MLRFPFVLLLPLAHGVGDWHVRSETSPRKHEHAQKHILSSKNTKTIELGHSGEAFTKIERDLGIW